MTRVVDVTCPGCGSPWSTDQRSCAYCGRQVVITSLSSLRDLTPLDLRKYLKAFDSALAAGSDQPNICAAQGICLLRLGRHEHALTSLEQAMLQDIDNPEVYFFAAVATLGGRKAFLNPLSRIREAESLAHSAIMLEDRGIFYFLLAYLSYDFYERKSLNPPQPWTELLDFAWRKGASQADVTLLFELLGVDNPLM